MERGLTHIICGDGKGKTTAAIGLSIRAAGRDKSVLIARFLKSNDSGELNVLETIANITVLPVEKYFGFTWNMTLELREEAGRYYATLLQSAMDKSIKENYDLLILDEIISAYNYEFIDHGVLLQFLRSKPDRLEVVMTGRNPAKALCEVSDYVSDIHMVKHPYEQGIPARIGIEY